MKHTAHRQDRSKIGPYIPLNIAFKSLSSGRGQYRTGARAGQQLADLRTLPPVIALRRGAGDRGFR